MLFIIAHHYVANSGLMAADGAIYENPMSWRSLFLLVFSAFGKTGINCFVLITGYFMCQSKITAKKFCKLLFEVEFYKVTIWLIFLITGYESFSLTGLFKAILPINNTIATGFTSCYLLFYLFIPFLNILIHNMNEKQHITLLALCSFVYVIIGTMPKFGITMNYISWFIIIYFIGAYIRLYDKKLFNNVKFWGWSTAGMFLLSIASVVGMTWIGARLGISGIGENSHWFMADSNKLFAVLLSISAFMLFKNAKIKNSKIINTVAASAFGVLMIHANSTTMRRWLWKDVLDNVGMYDSQWLVFHAIASVIAIYIVCTVIDYIRIQWIEKPFFVLWDKHWDKHKEKTNVIVHKVLKLKSE